MSANENITYRWESPAEWLAEKIKGMETATDFAALKSIALALLADVDGDTIQDTFQREMDQEGYFTPQPPDGIEVVTISYQCRVNQPGDEPEEGEREGYFTGEEDGEKRTFQPLDRSEPMYLFADEILEVN